MRSRGACSHAVIAYTQVIVSRKRPIAIVVLLKLLELWSLL